MKEVISSYFKAWQSPLDSGLLKSCLKNDFILDGSFGKIKGADNFIDFLIVNDNLWRNIKILGYIESDNKASLFYEGTVIKPRRKIRVAEYIEIENNLIKKITAVVN